MAKQATLTRQLKVRILPRHPFKIMRKSKVATAEYHREWYQKNKKKRRKQIEESQKKREKINREYADSYALERGCQVCGYKKCARVLDFHHVDPSTKTNSVSSMIHRHGLESVKEEIAKCVVLCANCHRELHAGEITLE